MSGVYQLDAPDASRMTTHAAIKPALAACGVAGPLALAAYFSAPLLAGWPDAGSSAAQLMPYALAHESLFYAGAWLQVTGTLLCVVFFIAIVLEAGAITRLSGVLIVIASATLLGLVLVEAALLAAVPAAAKAADAATVRTAFELSSGVFVRIFPLAPASLSYAALGFVILGSRVLNRWLGYAALALGVAFEVAGVLAVFTSVGFVIAIALSVVQELWIVAAAIAFWRSAR